MLGDELGRHLVHPWFAGVYFPLVIGAMLLAMWWRHRPARRRFQRVADLPAEDQRAAADALPTPEERSTARLALDLIDPLADAPKREEVFAYPKRTIRGFTLTYWGCLGLACFIGLIGCADDIYVDDHNFWPWFGLVAGFSVAAIVMHWGRQQARTRVFVSPFGVGEIKPSGVRKVVLWSQLTFVHNRPLLGQMEFHGLEPGQKVAVSHQLEHYVRFMQLVVAQLQFLYPSAAEPATSVDADDPATFDESDDSATSVHDDDATRPVDDADAEGSVGTVGAPPTTSRARLVVRGVLVALLLGAIWLLAKGAGYRLTHRIEDRSDLLNGTDASRLEDHLSRLYRESGVDIRFVLVDSVPGGALEEYALQRARARGRDRDRDRRVLVAYDAGRGRLRITVGPALDGILTDRFTGYLMRDGERGVASAGMLTSEVRFTLETLDARLRRAALGEAYDPRAAEFVAERRSVAEEPTSGRQRFGPQSTVEMAYDRYLEWLRDGRLETDVDLFTRPSQTYLQALPVSPAFTTHALFLEYGRAYRILVRGDLALLYFTDDPLVAPHCFRRTRGGWQMDLVTEVRDTREVDEGPWTWSLVERHDDFTGTFLDRYTAMGPLLRVAGGDDRPVPVRGAEIPSWAPLPQTRAPAGVEQLTTQEAAERISAARGRPVVVLLYSTGDRRTRRSFPAILAFLRRSQAGGAEVLAFSVDDRWDAVAALPGFLRGAPFGAVHLYPWPRGQLTKAMTPLGIKIDRVWYEPIAVLLDGDGRSVVQVDGRDFDITAVEAALDRLDR